MTWFASRSIKGISQRTDPARWPQHCSGRNNFNDAAVMRSPAGKDKKCFFRDQRRSGKRHFPSWQAAHQDQPLDVLQLCFFPVFCQKIAANTVAAGFQP